MRNVQFRPIFHSLRSLDQRNSKKGGAERGVTMNLVFALMILLKQFSSFKNQTIIQRLREPY